ncbi:acyl carrier protein [Capnocytophaga canimorsus]|uniref:Acyl carrier protein n=1 Tax=Capnocytophaga canimorsus TaxID=28188 RepID=A0A0B7HI51_9FLAO|nr:acyl carrier protein [Capnocytophaga canimorsus]ATA77274.1 acyl carrier protein [Capnocytophaga canimorsus]AWL78738.1 acyl carrier protein [Capnocytophaga canimorsus]AYW37348.1 acyl carrier protein [Capnocytophaga canimorsus]MDT9500120.1 acyl carrier protein [Capnocytophaga canimorsus]PJI83566.1 acyl carrier protein [Capnocytophaga canimorsus]
MREKIVEIMANVFEMNISDFPVEISQNTVENWDSLRHLNLIVEIEEAFDKSFEPEEISEMTSIDKIIEMIQR